MKNKTIIFFLVLFSFIFFESCQDKNEKEPCDTNQFADFETGTICSPKLMTYHFGVENLSVSNQIKTLSALEMDGMIVQIEDDNLSKLESYYQNCLVKTGEFNIYDIFTTFSLSNPKIYSKQLLKIDRIYKTIQNQNTILQVLFEGHKDDPRLTETISVIAEIAKKYGKSLVIYPHTGLAIETAEEALEQINLNNQNNIFLAIHLCHELAAGNENRINEVVQNVSPYIKSVSISGASISERSDQNLPIWFWGIKPLNIGTYNYNAFYQALYNVNYEGPIAIQTWGIHNNFNLFVPDYLPESKAILLNMSQELCE